MEETRNIKILLQVGMTHTQVSRVNSCKLLVRVYCMSVIGMMTGLVQTRNTALPTDVRKEKN